MYAFAWRISVARAVVLGMHRVSGACDIQYFVPAFVDDRIDCLLVD